MATTMDIQIQNRTTSNTVFAYITGQALANNNHVCLISADGKTPYYPPQPFSIGTPIAQNCSIPLGTPGSTITVTIPQLAGGRIWFAIGQKLTFLTNPGGNGAALVEPSVTNPSDPNINIAWDFCEFTFANGSIYANISYVDFISRSISLELTPTTGAVQRVLGLKEDGFASVCAGLESQTFTDANDWHKLIYQANGQSLRVLSPNNAIVMNGGNMFQGYYDSHVNDVWAKYTSTPITIDTQAKWGKVNGTVVNGALVFPGLASFSKPTTGDIFSCSTGPFANNAGATGPLTARISAGLNRSTLLLSEIHPEAKHVTSYYSHPITNHYARLVHLANQDGRGYAFPYDDVSGGGIDQSGFVNAAPKSFIVSIA